MPATSFAAQRAVVEPRALVRELLRGPRWRRTSTRQNPGARDEHDAAKPQRKPTRPGRRRPFGAGNGIVCGVGRQKVFRYSTIASLSAAGRSVPYAAPSWPRLLLPAHLPGTQTFASWRFSGFGSPRALGRTAEHCVS